MIKKYPRAVWSEDGTVFMIDQTKLPFKEEIFISKNYKTTCSAIINMVTRGAGSIGAAAGYAMMQASVHAPQVNRIDFLKKAKEDIKKTRPTARDLFAAVDRVYLAALQSVRESIKEAETIADETALAGKLIGEYGNNLIKDGYNILTHCNAGPLALVEYGSALAPIFKAHEEGKNIFVYVDETRPRNQGAKLTAWELKHANIPHKIIADNVAGMLMLNRQIDLVITGADRIVANGDTANKIGTLEKAVLAKEFNIPFYIAAPDSTFDLDLKSGEEISVEERSEDEVLYISGADEKGRISTLRIASPGSEAYNPAFDVTPYKYITGYITSDGIIKAEDICKK